MAAKIFRINYKSDFILTLTSDAGWMTPFCIKFWTGSPMLAYYASWDGEAYTHCAPVAGEPTKLQVQFDDHHLPIGDLKFQIAYHFTVADFPNDTEDEVLNHANITTEIDGETYQVMLDFTGETAPEIQFSLPAYANEAQRIANEQQRIANETQRIANEETRIQHEQQRIAAEQTRQQNEQQRINQEQARVNEYAGLKADAVAATGAANDAAALANQKAQLAADKAALAQDAADLANAKAQLAADEAALAASAAQLANDKAALAQQKAEYAQTQGGYAKDQGDYAKGQGDYAKAQGDTALADHQRAEADHGIAVDDHTQAGNDHTRAESDHGIAVDDHTQAGNDHTRAESDHGIAADDHTQAGNDHTRAESDHGIAADDHTRAESDHTRAESDHAAVELYVDSLGAFDISAYHATGGVLAKYADLTAALGTNGANIPDALRKGGMSVKFVHSSDNNYVQYRYMLPYAGNTTAENNKFKNPNNWQGVDSEPVANSRNLVKSGGVYKQGFGLSKDLFPFCYQDNSHADDEKRVDFVDEQNNILATINKDGIKTKDFDSKNIKEKVAEIEEDVSSMEEDLDSIIEESVVSRIFINEPSDTVCLQDDKNNKVAEISKDGIKTKNFDSKDIKEKVDELISGLPTSTVSLDNSDVITVLGSSFGETNVFPTNKHWSGIMSMFSDYRIQNLSLSGSNIVTNLYKIRTGSWIIDGTYVAITNTENNHGINVKQYLDGLDNLCSTLVGIGKIPVICTNYHASQYMCLTLRKYAYEHNFLFWDASNYCNTLVEAIYSGFDDGAHLRKRNAPMVAYAYLNHMHLLKRPFRSIKVFRLRDSNFAGNLDELVYFDNVERARKFMEIRIGTRITSQDYDEYYNLKNGVSVELGSHALVECVLPALSKDISALKVNLTTQNNGIKAYYKNNSSQPYPNPTNSSCVRFSVSDTINIPSEGDVYRVDNVDYTVINVVLGENNYYCTIYCSPNTLPQSTSGVLVMQSQVSGSAGESTIDFDLVESVSINLVDYIYADNQGHWIEIENDNNSFSIPQDAIKNSMQGDKLCVLLTSSDRTSAFSISGVNVECKAFQEKPHGVDREFVWSENNYIDSNELIQESTFGEVGNVLTDWQDSEGNSITSVANYEGSEAGVVKYPIGAKSEVVVTDSLSMNTTIPESTLNKFGYMWLEIYCRYFPNAPYPYTNQTDTEVNDSSYDFNTLYVSFGQNADGSGEQTTVIEEEVGLFWKIVRIPVCWFWQKYSGRTIKNMYLKLYSNSKGIEICKVSLKYKK